MKSLAARLSAVVLLLSAMPLTACGGAAFTSADTDPPGGDAVSKTVDGGAVDPTREASSGQNPSGTAKGVPDAADPVEDAAAPSQDAPDPAHDAGDAAPPKTTGDAKDAAPEAAAYDGPICCTWPPAPGSDAGPGICGGTYGTALTPDSDGGYDSRMSCPDGRCTVGAECIFNADVLYFDAGGECHGTVVACPSP